MIKNQNKKSVRRRILDYSLTLLREMFEYKAKMYGKKVILINRYYPSSQICSRCGFRHNPGEDETFICPVCGYKVDRDINAAINIYRYGIKNYLNKL